MIQRRLCLASAVLLAMAPTLCQAQQKVSLAYHAKKGQICRYTDQLNATINAQGHQLNIVISQVNRVTFSSIAANGDITELSKTEGGTEEIMGHKQQLPNTSSAPDTIVIHPDGTLASFKPGETDKTHLGVRLFVATSPVFPAAPLGAGDTWSHDYAANDSIGIRAAHADYKAIAFGEKDGAQAVEIHMHFAEDAGSKPIAADGTLWIEKSSGDTLESDMKVENLPFGATTRANAEVTTKRTEGSPLGDVKTGGVASASKTPKPKTIDDTVKGFQKMPGLFTLYRKQKGTSDTIYMEIAASQLGQPFLLEATARTGDTEHITPGSPINDILFKFEKAPDGRILMVVPNIAFRATPGTPVDRAVKRSFANARLEIFSVKATDAKTGAVLIDVSDLFRGDIAQVTDSFRGGILGGGAYGIDREKTFVTRVKSFPKNILVETSYNFQKLGGGAPAQGLADLLGGGNMLADDRSIPITIDYAVFSVAPDGYMPRLYDPRIGFFTTSYQDFDNDSKRSQKVEYIYRWNMRKANPRAAMSPPVKPIVFWLDNAIPTEYRGPIRRGLLEWNRAFARIGISNAIVVKQMPANAHWDQADMTHNVVRWVVSPSSGYAVSLMRINPITGEIINANITVDANLVRFTKVQRQEQVDPARYFTQLEQAPQPNALGSDSEPWDCKLMQDGALNAWEGNLAISLLAGADKTIDEKSYARAYIRMAVSHEMGHILGLRHNFLGSTFHTLKQLKNGKTVEDTGISASLMDYCPFNIEALQHKGVPFWQNRVGVYDEWAIQYGYTPINASTPQGELYQLHQIADKSNQPGHPYQSDEIADQFDPNVTRFDLGADPMHYWIKDAGLARHLMFTLYHRVPKPGRSYSAFTQDLYGLIGLYSQGASEVARYVGGLHVNRNFRGDAGEKPTLMPVSGAKQRKAVQMLDEMVFSANAFSLPEQYYTHLTVDQTAGFRVIAQRQDYPILDTISNTQSAALDFLFSGATLDRIANNEYKLHDAKGVFTMPELFHMVTGTVWSELFNGKNIGPLHRQLQRAWLSLMGNMVLGKSPSPADARMLAWYELREIRHEIAADQKKPHDLYTSVHLSESLMVINRILHAQQVIGGSAASGGSSLLQLLLGGQKAP